MRGSFLGFANTGHRLARIFGTGEDYRSYINQLHYLVDTLFIGVIPVICRVEVWKQINRVLNDKKEKEFKDLNINLELHL